MYTEIENHCIQEETVSSIGQFAILWGMVEEKYFDMCCNAGKLKNMQIGQNAETLALYADKIKAALMSHYESSETIKERLRFRSNDKGFTVKVAPFLDDMATSGSDKVYAGICICFRIRNNLFHGEKVFWLLNQQVQLIDACSAFLNELISEDNVLAIYEADK